MKSFIAVLALVAIAAADVSHIVGHHPEADAQIVKQAADVGPESYQYVAETSNGISLQESGSLVSSGNNEPSIAVQGSNSYTSPEGVVVKTVYVANEFGFQPQGDHLPTPPAPLPIPEAILRSLEYIRTHATPETPLKRNY